MRWKGWCGQLRAHRFGKPRYGDIKAFSSVTASWGSFLTWSEWMFSYLMRLALTWHADVAKSSAVLPCCTAAQLHSSSQSIIIVKQHLSVSFCFGFTCTMTESISRAWRAFPGHGWRMFPGHGVRRIGVHVSSLDRWTTRVQILPGLAGLLDPPACHSWQKRHRPWGRWEKKKKQKLIHSIMWRGRGSFTFQTGKQKNAGHFSSEK